jgi:hypothetical protein
MAIITAPYLSESGRKAGWGYFCLGCQEEKEATRHFRIKYAREQVAEHLARLDGPVKETPRIPGRFLNVTQEVWQSRRS